jgi:hypothetical protein
MNRNALAINRQRSLINNALARNQMMQDPSEIGADQGRAILDGLWNFGGGAQNGNETGIAGKLLSQIGLDASGQRSAQPLPDAIANTAHAFSPESLYGMAQGVYGAGNRLMSGGSPMTRTGPDAAELTAQDQAMYTHEKQAMDAFGIASALPAGGLLARAPEGAVGSNALRREAVNQEPITAWHASAADFDKFDPKFAGTGGGGSDYGNSMHFGDADIAGLNGKWTNQVRKESGKSNVYQVEIDPSNHLDATKTFYDLPPDVQTTLKSHENDIRNTWGANPATAEFNGAPYNPRDPAQVAGVHLLANFNDRTAALKVMKDALASENPGYFSSRRAELSGIIKHLEGGTEALPDLFSKTHGLSAQYNGGFLPKTPLSFKSVRSGNEIAVVDPEAINIKHKWADDGTQLFANPNDPYLALALSQAAPTDTPQNALARRY